MANWPMPTVSELAALLHYDPSSGRFFWKPREKTQFGGVNGFKKFNGLYAGKEALTNLSQYGYRRGTVLRRCVLAHRVAWALFYGEHPLGPIDHINGVRCDNRIANLRLASVAENSRNTKGRKATSQFKGVSLLKNGQWHARIVVDGCAHLAGNFNSEEEAAFAHDRLAEKLHGEFAWLNSNHHTILSRGHG